MRRIALPSLLLLLLLSAVPVVAAAPAPVTRLVSGNPADRLLSVALEDHAYDYATRCRRRPSPGAVALQAWLERNVLGSAWGIVRCEKLSDEHYSLHAEGRAIDWHLSASDPRERRAAEKLIRLLLAPDRLGNPHALARRMGVQELIWNCRSWWSGSEGMERYSRCYGRRGKRERISDTLAHRDHVHIGLSRVGARKRTSFWLHPR